MAPRYRALLSRSYGCMQENTSIRRCEKCKNEKPVSEFYLRRNRNKLKTGLRWEYICKVCQRERRKAYYASRRDDFRKRARMCESRQRKENRLRIFEYLLAHPCVDCRETDIIVLEFDHRDGEKKIDNVSSMPKHYGWDRIWREIQKCDVRCIKCHRHRHAEKKKIINSYEKYLALKAELYGPTASI